MRALPKSMLAILPLALSACGPAMYETEPVDAGGVPSTQLPDPGSDGTTPTGGDTTSGGTTSQSGTGGDPDTGANSSGGSTANLPNLASAVILDQTNLDEVSGSFASIADNDINTVFHFEDPLNTSASWITFSLPEGVSEFEEIQLRSPDDCRLDSAGLYVAPRSVSAPLVSWQLAGGFEINSAWTRVGPITPATGVTGIASYRHSNGKIDAGKVGLLFNADDCGDLWVSYHDHKISEMTIR